jgi:NAD+ synthase
LKVPELVSALVNWLQQQLQESGLKGYVVGLSGGIDSSVVAVLCKKACPENTLGVIMPCYNNSRDARDAELIAHLFDIPFVTVVLNDVYRLLAEMLTGKRFAELDYTDITLANLKPRLRMTTLYFFANQRQALVAGTSNRSELTIGYFTKYGDGGADVLPIGCLLKFQVREVATYLGIPEAIVNRQPSASLWEGQEDVRELGFTYDELDRYILGGEVSPGVQERIASLCARNRHKLKMPPIPELVES